MRINPSASLRHNDVCQVASCTKPSQMVLGLPCVVATELQWKHERSSEHRMGTAPHRLGLCKTLHRLCSSPLNKEGPWAAKQTLHTFQMQTASTPLQNGHSFGNRIITLCRTSRRQQLYSKCTNKILAASRYTTAGQVANAGQLQLNNQHFRCLGLQLSCLQLCGILQAVDDAAVGDPLGLGITQCHESRVLGCDLGSQGSVGWWASCQGLQAC